ncbi:MAG: glycoside hydrolase family 3 protein [Atopobiaceae bacterium]|nr:glycoside hydrolase family 3 protein [Atopobiaceae bacterium]
MIPAKKLVGRAARAVIRTFTGSNLAQDSVAAEVEANTAPGMPALARQAAAEGCVLLTNDATLPLSPDAPIAVFGRRQIDWAHMGNGSGGDVNPPYLTNLLDGLEDVGARYDHVLAELYRSWCADPKHAKDPGFWGHWPHCLPEMTISHELARAAAADAEVALVVIGRTAGEDQDLAPEPGGYYLTSDEHELLQTVSEHFSHMVVVLDVCNIIDLSWMDLYAPKLSAVLIAWAGGMEAGNAVADVLYGRVNPCGRLTDAIALDLADHPSSATFGQTKRQEYTEGIFIGHRHFSTFAPNEMRFPLGHGLSYTSFSYEPLGCERHDMSIYLRIYVTNTGPRAGRDAIVAWCEAPRGLIQKPLTVVAAFGKTGELQPGESEEVTLVAELRDIASFDETRRAFVLERGAYLFRASDMLLGKVALDDDVTFEHLKPICSEDVDLRARILSHVERLEGSESDASALSLPELEALTRGAGTMNVSAGPTGNAGAFGGITPELQARGIPPVICADGPSGARLARRCSLLPCATALASTWDVDLVRSLYALVGHEVAEAGVDVLLAPGMNLHRSPLCGRNFEYFSEDPVLTGHMASAVVEGLRSAGVDACPKHFACNNQERGRNTLDVRVDERTLRELYLRPFQICVRDAKPRLIMTSYNKVNGVWAHYGFDLVTTVLRGEWGFEGVVITDWWMQRSRSPEFPTLRDNAYRVRAGVDVLMPGNIGRVARGYRAHPSLLESLGKPDGITRAEIEACAARVLAFIMQPKR